MAEPPQKKVRNRDSIYRNYFLTGEMAFPPHVQATSHRQFMGHSTDSVPFVIEEDETMNIKIFSFFFI